jgi:DNA-3-methyladenine glycosylase I
VAYHDTEWGVPQHDDAALFEMLCLEGAQAGLSWLTILRKRNAYRRAFDGFDAEKMARYGPERARRLMQDAGIVRNRLKVAAFIGNARAYLALRERHGSFDAFVWRHVRGQPRRRRPLRGAAPRTHSAESDALSRALRAAGFRFVGTTICYAFMQAVGMLDEHQRHCAFGKRAGSITGAASPRSARIRPGAARR